MSSDADGLGPLPMGAVYTRALGSVGAAMYTYTADQMRAYAAAQVAAERERCAVLADAYLQGRIGCTYGAGDAVRGKWS